MLLTARPAVAQTSPTPVCPQEAVFADDLAARGFTPPPPSYKGYFTSDIGMNGAGDLAIVGEYGGGGSVEPNPQQGPGLVRIYSNRSGAWLQTHAFGSGSPQSGERFGFSVDIDDHFAIVAAPFRVQEGTGATGAIFFFKYDSVEGEWDDENPQTIFNPGHSDDAFSALGGQHEGVAIDGRIAAVSATNATVGGHTGAGVVYVYGYDSIAGAWQLESTITAPTPVTQAHFGHSIELSGSSLAIGAPGDGASGGVGGGAFVFRRSASSGSVTWTCEAELDGGTLAAEGDSYGQAVSIDGNAVAVGAPNADAAFVYGYNVTSGEWELYDELKVATTPQRFGLNVSLRSSLLLVGAPWYGDITYTGGAAYVYQRSVGGWDAHSILVSKESIYGDDRVGETLALGSDEAFIGVLSYDLNPAFQGTQEGGLLIFSDVPGCSN